MVCMQRPCCVGAPACANPSHLPCCQRCSGCTGSCNLLKMLSVGVMHWSWVVTTCSTQHGSGTWSAGPAYQGMSSTVGLLSWSMVDKHAIQCLATAVTGRHLGAHDLLWCCSATEWFCVCAHHSAEQRSNLEPCNVSATDSLYRPPATVADSNSATACTGCQPGFGSQDSFSHGCTWHAS